MSAALRPVRGGVFALEPEALGGPAPPAPGPFADALRGRGRFLATSHARGALDWLVRFLDAPRVWLPAYLCDALLGGAVRERAAFYPVDERLEPLPGDWRGRIGADDLTVAIAYFGWPPSAALVDALRTTGARLAVDASQALLSTGIERDADYLFASPRKFVGVPDGGLLVPVGDAPWPAALPQLEPWDQLAAARAAGAARRDFDARGGNGGERDWYDLFRAAEGAAPEEAHALSDDTRRRLGHGVDWDAVVRARRANWSRLAVGLEDRLLFGELSAGVVPLGCPLRLRDGDEADRVRTALYAEAVYAPRHWDLGTAVPTDYVDAHRLSRRQLTLPCDQRYDGEDMDAIRTIVVSSIGGGAP